MLIMFFSWLQTIWMCVWMWIKNGWPNDYLPPMIVFAAFILSICTYIHAKHRESFKLGIDLILKMGEQFDSPAMLKHRAIAANALLSQKTENNISVNAVLDFFEEIGFLWKREAIDSDAIDTYFSTWLLAYYGTTTKYIEERKAPRLWDYFKAIGKHMERYENRCQSKWTWNWPHCIAWHILLKHKKSNWLDSNCRQEEFRKILEEERKKVPKNFHSYDLWRKARRTK